MKTLHIIESNPIWIQIKNYFKFFDIKNLFHETNKYSHSKKLRKMYRTYYDLYLFTKIEDKFWLEIKIIKSIFIINLNDSNNTSKSIKTNLISNKKC